MIIIHDARIPQLAKETLAQYGTLVPLLSEDITHSAIAGHPDVFCTQIDNKLIVAPNAPKSFIEALQTYGVSFAFGEKKVGSAKHETTPYNIAISEKVAIHYFKYTDPVVLEMLGNRKRIAVKQGLARCSTLPLRNNTFITSDEGVAKQLKAENINHLYVSPQQILLPGLSHGCIGGCFGVHNDHLFLIGNLKNHPESAKITAFLTNINYKITMLYNGPLFDGGSLFFC